MPHIELSGKRLIDMLEHLCDGILALSTLTEHILLASWGIEVDTRHTSALLPTVVLLLHHQVELVQAIAPGAVFLFVIRQGLQQANHRHTTFMLQLFHRYMHLRTT